MQTLAETPRKGGSPRSLKEKHMLNSLRTLHHGAHLMPARISSFVLGEPYKAAVKQLENNDDLKAFMTLRLLVGLALDPLSGSTPEAFMVQYDDRVGFNLRFHGTVNPIGLFELPVTSGRVPELKAAIETNLNSRMFKAAKMVHRMRRRHSRLCSIAAEKAGAACAAVLTECTARPTPLEVWERGQEAFDRVYVGWTCRSEDRLSRIAHHATPLFNEGWTLSLAKFLYWNLPCRG